MNLPLRNCHFCTVGRMLAALIFSLVVGGAGLPAVALGQSGGKPDTGVIEGRVLNVTSGNYLNNARITVEGTEIQVFTNEFGQYRITGAPVGAVTVRSSYTGFEPQLAEVEVLAGKVATRDFEFKFQGTREASDRTVVMDTFEVAEVKETNASAIAMNEQRYSANLKNVVSSDEFGGVAEGNIGEFLKFLPGVTLEYVGPDARSASVRGMPAENTGVNIDGLSVASTGAGTANRQFEFDQLSINNVSRIEVTKGPTPDGPADSIGGTVNLVSKSAFERSRPQFTYRAYATLLHHDTQDVNFITFKKSPNPEPTPSVKIQPNVEFTYINPVTKNFGFTLTGMQTNIFSQQYVTTPRWSPTSAQGTPGTVATLANPALTSFRFFDGPKFTTRNSIGATIDWRIAPNDVISVRGSWNEFDSTFRNQIFDTATGVPTAHDSTFTQSGNTSATFASNGHQVSMRRALRRTYVVNGQWRHNGPVWKFNVAGSYSNSRAYFRDMDEGHFASTQLVRPGLRVRYDDIEDSVPGRITATTPAGVPVDIQSLGSYNFTVANTQPVDSINRNKNASASVSRFFDIGVPVKVKMGVDYKSVTSFAYNPFRQWTFVGRDGIANNADNSAANYDLLDVYATSLGAPYNLGPFQYVSPLKAFDLYSTQPSYFVENEVYRVQQQALNSREITEDITAPYVRFDFRLLSNRLWVVAGVRYERTTDDGSGPLNDITRTYQRDASGKLILNAQGRPIKIVGDAVTLARLQYVERGVSVTKSYGHYFPSVNLTYTITPDLVARASFAETIARPNYNIILPGTTLPDPDGTGRIITINNIELKPWTAKNYDLSLAYYLKGGGEVSAGVFRKDIADFFASGDLDVTPELLELYGIDQSYVNGGYILRTQRNLDTAARVDGLEFSYRQPLKFLPDWARGVYVRYNITKLSLSGDAEANFNRFIPLSQNWGVSLDRKKYNIRLNWNSRGRQQRGLITGVAEPGTYEYVRARLTLDVEMEYRFRKELAVFAGARNVTGEPEVVQRYGPNTPGYARNFQVAHHGATISVGVKGTF